MKAKVRVLRGPLTGLIGSNVIVVQTENSARIVDVLEILAQKYGKSFRDYIFDPRTNRVNSYLLFALNGVNVNSAKGTETEMEDDDELLILSATGGG